jgi:hypothetical protein
MRRVLVLERDAAAREVIRDVARLLGCVAVYFETACAAHHAWVSSVIEFPDGRRGSTFHVAVFDGRAHDEGLDLARFARATCPACTVILTVDDAEETYQACDAIGAACVARAELRRGLIREIGFDGTLPAGLAGRKAP